MDVNRNTNVRRNGNGVLVQPLENPKTKVIIDGTNFIQLETKSIRKDERIDPVKRHWCKAVKVYVGITVVVHVQHRYNWCSFGSIGYPSVSVRNGHKGCSSDRNG